MENEKVNNMVKKNIKMENEKNLQWSLAPGVILISISETWFYTNSSRHAY